MNDKEISILMMESMNEFHNLVKVVNNERGKAEKVFTERQFFALVSIRKHKKIELKNLSKDLHVSTSSLCILLNKLVEQGYVYREEDSRDRRNTFYGITEKGQMILDEEIEKFLSVVTNRISCLNHEDKQTLFNSLSDMKIIMAKIFKATY